jgi:hypothetical protein
VDTRAFFGPDDSSQRRTSPCAEISAANACVSSGKLCAGRRMSASGHTSATCDDGIAMSACWFKPHVVRCPSRSITCHFASPASALRRIVEAHPISMARSRRTKLPPRSRRVTINETQSITQFEILVGRPGPSRRLGAVPSFAARKENSRLGRAPCADYRGNQHAVHVARTEHFLERHHAVGGERARVPNLGISNRSQSASNRVSCITHGY